MRTVCGARERGLSTKTKFKLRKGQLSNLVSAQPRVPAGPLPWRPATNNGPAPKVPARRLTPPHPATTVYSVPLQYATGIPRNRSSGPFGRHEAAPTEPDSVSIGTARRNHAVKGRPLFPGSREKAAAYSLAARLYKFLGPWAVATG